MAGLIKGIQVIGAISAVNDIQSTASREGIYVWRINLSALRQKGSC
jgi:hypothetical protein